MEEDKAQKSSPFSSVGGWKKGIVFISGLVCAKKRAALGGDGLPKNAERPGGGLAESFGGAGGGSLGRGNPLCP